MKTLLLAPGNANVSQLDVLGLLIEASRPSPALTGYHLTALPMVGGFPAIRFRRNGPPIRMDVAVVEITKAGIFCKPQKLSFGRKARKPRAPKRHIVEPFEPTRRKCAPADLAQPPAGAHQPPVVAPQERRPEPTNLPTDPADSAGGSVEASQTAAPVAEVQEKLPPGDHEVAGSTEDTHEEVAPTTDAPAPGSDDGPGASGEEDAMRIRITRCSDALLAAGFNASDILVVENWTRGGAVVRNPRTGQEHVITDSEYRIHYA